MSDQLLNYFGKSHASHLHARGKWATHKLIELLAPADNEQVLELGFGTGATLVQIAASYNKANYFGYEINPVMFKKAFQRIGFCGLRNKIKLFLLDKPNEFPAADNTFDKVYAESILAIQEGDQLRETLLEIKRVLKPNGRLVFNETIWLDATSKELAKSINENCKKEFGIIQSNHDFPHMRDWKGLLNATGFDCLSETPVSEISTQSSSKKSLAGLLSLMYTVYGKIRASLSPSMIKEWREYSSKMQHITGNVPLMEGYIFNAVKRA